MGTIHAGDVVRLQSLSIYWHFMVHCGFISLRFVLHELKTRHSGEPFAHLIVSPRPKMWFHWSSLHKFAAKL